MKIEMNYSEFVVGDKVNCLSSCHPSFEVGRKYLVVNVQINGFGMTLIRLDDIGNGIGDVVYASKTKFEKVVI